MNKEKFTLMLSGIVASEYPSQSDVFEFEKDKIIGSLFDTGSVPEANRDLATNAFGEPIKETLEFILLIIGTYEAFRKILVVPNDEETDVDPDELSKNWSKELVRAGLSKKKAAKIAKKFIRQIK